MLFLPLLPAPATAGHQSVAHPVSWPTPDSAYTKQDSTNRPYYFDWHSSWASTIECGSLQGAAAAATATATAVVAVLTVVPRNQVNVRGWVPSDSSTVVSSADEGDKGKETEKQQGAMPGLAVERVYMTCSNGGARVGTGTCTGAGGGAGAASTHETLDVYILGTNAQLFIAPIAWNMQPM